MIGFCLQYKASFCSTYNMYHSLRISNIQPFLLSFFLLPLLLGPMFIHTSLFECQNTQQIIPTIINQTQWHHQRKQQKHRKMLGQATTASWLTSSSVHALAVPRRERHLPVTSWIRVVHRPPSSQSKITKKPKKDNAALEDTTAKPLGVVNDKVNIENAV